MSHLRLQGSSESVKSASIIQLSAKGVSVIAQFAITMVLARILSPEEFGVVAILTAFTGFFSVLSDAGISTAIAQFQDLEEKDYRRLFFFGLLMGCALSIAFFALSAVIAWFYRDLIYIPLGAVLTLSVLFNSLNMVPNGVLLKERKFKLIGLRLIISTVTVGAVVIFLSIAGLGCFAIVLNSVLTSLFILVWNLATSKLRMSFGSVVPILRKVGSFSAFQLGHEAIVWFSGNLDSLLAGKMFGPAALGYYNKAYTVYGYPFSLLTAPITSTLVPFLSPLQHDRKLMYGKFIAIIHKVSYLMAFCSVVMSLCSSEIVYIMFGENWKPVIPLLRVLALAVYARGVNSVHAPLMSASGRTDLLMRSTLINTLMTIIMILLGGYLGSVQTLATCVAIAYNFELIIPVYLCAHYCLGRKVFEYFLQLLPDIIVAAVILIVGYLIPWQIDNIFLSLLFKIFFCDFPFLIYGVVGKRIPIKVRQ